MICDDDDDDDDFALCVALESSLYHVAVVILVEFFEQLYLLSKFVLLIGFVCSREGSNNQLSQTFQRARRQHASAISRQAQRRLGFEATSLRPKSTTLVSQLVVYENSGAIQHSGIFRIPRHAGNYAS